MNLPNEDFEAVQQGIDQTITEGTRIRKRLAQHSNQGPFNAEWEVEAAVELRLDELVDPLAGFHSQTNGSLAAGISVRSSTHFGSQSRILSCHRLPISVPMSVPLDVRISAAVPIQLPKRSH